MSFESDVSKFVEDATKNIDITRKAIATELFVSITRDTPVDTGRARGNWIASKGSPATETTDNKKSPIKAIKAAVDAAHVDEALYLTNNLPYIKELEYGSSKKAPEGMVRRNMARIGRIAKNIARQHKK